ncbi:hypothetical protein niasHT_032217 [Heterodera trifolii]|uniref:B30.2/SPRY domain-containing protein n=1 Tax=Heterodera trifolii TaxID=157864 RepID=A0ABD2HY35_9BILA
MLNGNRLTDNWTKNEKEKSFLQMVEQFQLEEEKMKKHMEESEQKWAEILLTNGRQLEKGIANLEEENWRKQMEENERQWTVGRMNGRQLSEMEIANHWDPPSPCPASLLLTSPGVLCVEHTGPNNECFSVLAKWPIPKTGTFYFEVKCSSRHMKMGAAIGLATKQMPSDEWVGQCRGTYSYSSHGILYGHNVAGRDEQCFAPCFYENVPPFGYYDVMGCGIDLATRQIFYTKNGRRLVTPILLVAPLSVDLFPCVSLCCSKMEANFGPKDFNYKNSNAIPKRTSDE